MADDEGTTGVTGVTGGTTEGTTPKTPTTNETPLQPPSSDNNNNNKNVDVEAQPIKVEPLGIKSFDCAIARRYFVMKVFGMVGCMLAVVLLMTLLPFVSNGFRIFAFRNMWIWWISYVFYIATYLALVCIPCLRKTAPYNYLFTGLLVFSMGWLTIGITIHSDAEVVLLALVMTSICTFATIVFAMKTNFDITRCGPILCLIGIVMLIFFIVALIASIFFQVKWLYTVYAGLMTLLMMAYLAYDVQMMIGGRRHEVSINDPFYAAIQIFVDIVAMFWYMVQFIQGVQG